MKGTELQSQEEKHPYIHDTLRHSHTLPTVPGCPAGFVALLEARSDALIA